MTGAQQADGLSSDGSSRQVVSPVPASIPSAAMLGSIIRGALADNPTWLPEAIAAVSHGATLAIANLDQKRADADAACLAALVLCDAKRLSHDLRTTLLGLITKPMNAASLCELERKFATQAIEARKPTPGEAA